MSWSLTFGNPKAHRPCVISYFTPNGVLRYLWLLCNGRYSFVRISEMSVLFYLKLFQIPSSHKQLGLPCHTVSCTYLDPPSDSLTPNRHICDTRR